MKSIKNLIEPDKRSEGWPPEWLESRFAEVPLSHKVPKNIREMISLAQDLAYYGYFKYEFYDMAIFYLCLTFEAALRTRYSDSKSKFSKLIRDAKANRLFPLLFETKVNHIKKMRDNHAHPKGATIVPLFVRVFHLTTYLINCIFDKKVRSVYPSIFAKEIEEAKRNQILWEAISRISKYNISPGESFEIAGSTTSYDEGTYKCAKCETIQVINRSKNDLLPCKKCGETIFLFLG